MDTRFRGWHRWCALEGWSGRAFRKDSADRRCFGLVPLAEHFLLRIQWAAARPAGALLDRTRYEAAEIGPEAVAVVPRFGAVATGGRR